MQKGFEFLSSSRPRTYLEPRKVVADGSVVMMAVWVRWLFDLVRVPVLNTTRHHVTLCRASSDEEAEVLAKRLRSFGSARHGSQATWEPLAKEASLCKTAWRVVRMDELVQRFCHAIPDATCSFEPDTCM